MTEPRRVLVTGSRAWARPREVWDALDEQLGLALGAGVVVVHGDCLGGADAFAKAWALARGQQQDPHPADWDTCTDTCDHPPAATRAGEVYCPAAGPRRNREMVDAGADVVLAFRVFSARNKGTRGTIGMAREAGLPVKLFTHP